MLRKIIVPVQQWLLRHKQCVGCGRPLQMGKVKKKNGKTQVFCHCGRIFIKEGNSYRRALFEEI
ncbi:MAG: hypothetical protein ACOX6V_04275 [Patescibacteria group bacterium]|jgi:hypothetical protein